MPAPQKAPIKALLAWAVCGFLGHSAFGQDNIVSGSGVVVHSDISHPNGNVYDQLLITGQTLTVRANAGQLVRVSFIDPSNDIIQCEFAGAGTMRIEFDPATFSPPAEPVNYNQPGVRYAKGLAALTLEGTDASTSFAIYAIGRATSNFAALFKDEVAYDGFADLSLLRINGPDMSGIFAGNARFSSNRGTVGIDAPNTRIHNRLIFHDIDALGSANAVLRIAENSPLLLDSGSVLISSGDLHQSNGSNLDVRSSSDKSNLHLKSVNGVKAGGEALEKLQISRASRWLAGSGFVWVDGEPIVSNGLESFPASPKQLAKFRISPFVVTEAEDGFHFDEENLRWQYDEIHHADDIEATITYSGVYAYVLTRGGTGFDILLDYEFQSVSLAGFVKTVTIDDESNPALPRHAVISARSNGKFDSLVTLKDGTERTRTGNYIEEGTLRLPGLDSAIN